MVRPGLQEPDDSCCRLRVALGCGEKECKSGVTPVRGRLHTATVGLEYGAHNGQTKSSAFALSCPGWVDTVKAVENVGQVFGGYLWPRVLHAQ